MLTLVVAAGAAGCSASHANTGATARTTLITSDSWSPPVVSGPPSVAAFCTLLVAAYRHEGTLPLAASLKVREDIVRDYVELAPEMTAKAPPSIAPAAKLYINGVADAMAALNQVGLNAGKLKPGQIAVNLLSPQMRTAAGVVQSFSRTKCHYTIGG